MSTGAPLSALVVYESMFHNTESVAHAVARGLEAEGVHTRTVPVTAAPALGSVDADLLVVGAPTHAFSLSRPATRQDAVRQGADPAVASTGVRNWLAAATPRRAVARPVAAMFDTRVRQTRHLPKSAASRGRPLLRRLGLTVLVPPRGFLVDDLHGPLLEDELEHAVAWGRSLARTCQDHLAAEAVSRPRG
ncbi:MAG: hypothetical protein JWR42_1275 [Marmoricola sp.]|nr:hypothetical protein [Marmoricola sp.]